MVENMPLLSGGLVSASCFVLCQSALVAVHCFYIRSEHFGLKCNEVEKKTEVNLRTKMWVFLLSLICYSFLFFLRKASYHSSALTRRYE